MDIMERYISKSVTNKTMTNKSATRKSVTKKSENRKSEISKQAYKMSFYKSIFFYGTIFLIIKFKLDKGVLSFDLRQVKLTDPYQLALTTPPYLVIACFLVSNS